MAAGMLAFALGVVVLQSCSALPDAVAMAGLGAVALLCGLRRRLWPLSAFCLGLLWAATQAHWALERRLPRGLERVDMDLVGEVVGLPERQPRYTRFEIKPRSLGRLPADRLPRRIKLGWYGEAPPELRPGTLWHLRVRLKRPHGLQNPGGFDYERWLFANRIDATGYVRKQEMARLLSRGWSLDRLRMAIADGIEAQLPGHPARGVVLALVVGDGRLISDEQWEWLRITGTTHLVAISGLHVALAAWLFYRLVWFGWRRRPSLCLYLPAQLVATGAAAIAAIAYAALAGFSLPTQRALIMLAVPAIGLLARRRLRPWRAWSLALAAVLLWDPFAPLSPGFWLSFAAVAVLLAVAACRGKVGHWQRHLRPQLVISLALLPLTALWFQQAAWLGPLANLAAIPVVGLGLVPLALAATAIVFIWPAAGALLLGLTADLTHWVLRALEWLSRADGGASALVALPAWALLCGLVAAALALFPRGLAPRWLVLPLMLPFVFYRPAVADTPAGARVTVLDVGQGLSVVVEGGGRTLVYDTGPAFGKVDAGTRVVLPYLRARGIERIDLLVVSHSDNDHSGGLGAILRGVAVGELLGGEALPGTAKERRCRVGQHWRWGEIELRMLWPERRGRREGNNASCVLLVRVGELRLLLTGDIEAEAEAALLQARAESLRAEVIIVPHHGSASSSTAALIAAVRPDYAVMSAGYRNRYGFPRPPVLARYRAAGAEVLSTYATGALSFFLRPDGLAGPRSYRAELARYYHDPAE